jgi:hypothetical protein
MITADEPMANALAAKFPVTPIYKNTFHTQDRE